MQIASHTIGFPKMMEEAGEKRAFLPGFIQSLAEMGFQVLIETGYGKELGFGYDDYHAGRKSIREGSREEAFSQDIALILRSPHDEEFELIGKNTCLMSMLHYPTHPLRRELLKNFGVHAISLDSIKDDFNTRLVENMRAVGWNGLEAAFNEFEKEYPDLVRPDGRAWRVTVLGTGMVGRQAVDAATKFGRRERNLRHMRADGEGAVVSALGRNITFHKDRVMQFLEETDILVDSTQRDDPSRPVITNDQLAVLPEGAIIVDLSVDPYTLDADPPVVKGIEGIPQGNLDQYVFEPDDPKWDESVPKAIPSKNRRKTITCYSWPGIHPLDCMRRYGQQLRPLMRVLFRKDYEALSASGRYFERALYRAKLDTFLDNMEA